jgi:TatD DNase family protein
MHPTLVDIGLNLAHDSFDHDRDHVVSSAVAVGVRHMVITGSTLDSTRAAIELARAAPDRFRATAGIHPHHAHEFHEADLPALRDLLRAPEVGAAGECGLDYFRNFSPPAEQRRAFATQLRLASERMLPLFLHQRDAHADFVAMLREHPQLAARAVLHCFTDGPREAEDCLALGLSLGVTGWICDERRGQALRDAVSRIPDDRLMLETDAPYLLPRTLQPKPPHRRNEPMYLPEVLRETARCRGQAPEDVAARTTANACRFFSLTLESASNLLI